MEPDFSETSDRFYLLKKDSQRRAFVVRVLKVDKALIIDSWHRIIAKPDSLTKVRFSAPLELNGVAAVLHCVVPI